MLAFCVENNKIMSMEQQCRVSHMPFVICSLEAFVKWYVTDIRPNSHFVLTASCEQCEITVSSCTIHWTEILKCIPNVNVEFNNQTRLFWNCVTLIEIQFIYSLYWSIQSTKNILTNNVFSFNLVLITLNEFRLPFNFNLLCIIIFNCKIQVMHAFCVVLIT